ncbi:hypothetical protein BG000_007250 [Podila horticola]|nr:hypothetical protein BG000_007250 [Podila horticola]
MSSPSQPSEPKGDAGSVGTHNHNKTDAHTTSLPDPHPEQQSQQQNQHHNEDAHPQLQRSLRINMPEPTPSQNPENTRFTDSPTSYRAPSIAIPDGDNTSIDMGSEGGSGAMNRVRQLAEPLKSRLQASQTFAEGMSGSIQSLRRKAFERMQSTKDSLMRTPGAETITGSIRSETGSNSSHALHTVMPRSRPTMAQVRNPARMIIPPRYGEEEVQEAAIALAAGIPDGIPGSHDPASKILSDSESVTSDDEPEVRVHFEIHLQEDADSEPICPLSEKNVNTLVQELELTTQERAEVEAIQTKEELANYFEKIPRDYDVQIIVSEAHDPDSPGVTFAQDDQILNGDCIAIVRRESITSFAKEKKNRRKKQRYRRPTTDLSSMPVEEPKASWLELFYDLLFVANLTQFTHSHPITSGAALLHYICWFVIMWWAWAGQTFWAARYDMDDLFTKLFKLVEFCALISFGAFSTDHLEGTTTGFVASYCILKGVLMIEYSNVLFWARRNRSKKSTTPLVLHIAGNLTAIVIWSLSTMVHDVNWRYVMWFSSIALEIIVLVVFSRRSSVTFAGSHLPERFALFTIIVLGENVIGIIGLSAGAANWVAGNDPFLILFLLNTVILYSLWWLYFDDFSEDVFHKTTTLSQLWAYLHLPLHICIVLVGTGSIDLIKLYKRDHHITVEEGHFTSAAAIPRGPFSTNAYGTQLPTGFEMPLYRKMAAGGGAGALEIEPDFDLTKRYFLVGGALVFLCNSLLKWINLRSYDRFQKIVYISRFLCSMLMLCLLAVPMELLTPFALLGSMAFFCVLVVGVDLAVIYFGAYGFVEDLEVWAKSARSSIDIGSFLPSPLGGRSRNNSRPGSKAGSVVNLNSLGGHLGKHNTSAANLGSYPTYLHPHNPSNKNSSSYFFQQQQQNQQKQHLALQQQPPTTLSQQQQMELYNMHVNANSLGSSGAYGNLVQALAEIKNRERLQVSQRQSGLVPTLSNTAVSSTGASLPGQVSARRLSVSATEKGQGYSSGALSSFDTLRGLGQGQGQGSHHRTQNQISIKRPGSAAAASGQGGLYKVRSNNSSIGGAGSSPSTTPPLARSTNMGGIDAGGAKPVGLATMFSAQPTQAHQKTN